MVSKTATIAVLQRRKELADYLRFIRRGARLKINRKLTLKEAKLIMPFLR